MVNVIIKTDERKAAEASTLREFGIRSDGNAEQREMAAKVTADNLIIKKEFRRMEEMSK